MDESSFIIGVDLDGVVGDFYGAMRRIAAEWLDRPLESLPEEVGFGLDEWGIAEFGGYDRLHRFAVTQRNLFRDMTPIKDAPAVLRKLSMHGIRIRIITHRLFLKYFHKTSITQTVDWLDSYDIPYWDICFMADKGAVGAHVYIDDSPDNVTRLRDQGCRTIVFTNSTNRRIAGPRADTWQDVERLVMDAKEEWTTGTLDLFGATGFRTR
ncbi:5 nucleotidase, deoxy, cytosolic type C [Treponema primitia ZAS-2]|uniref:5 nucleotidase, deoxy, cytosolic type C n=1 Tax=Treponema primitia (strain ATCC BAA-887 / DSM 12427 / ZAS-2) TaxID=545694 RepID=F5YIQ7_TREPZ|nr:5'-nucleotidase [Treponema primitia]AEF86627.1 5 nucleotidase, deoxy, cytosolic type C [Treponema primitia ZAS-2]